MTDVVITWVDGNRPGFSQHLAAAIARFTHQTGAPPPPRAVSPGRFRDGGTLRFALRGLWQNTPWIKTIHLVTAGETPLWLDTSHPAINHVTHAAIFAPGTAQPNFNSNAIETHLHRIAGLSQLFLYLNDDIVILKPLGEDYFITPAGQPIFAFEPREMRAALDYPTEVGAAEAYCRGLLTARFGARPGRLVNAHEPMLFDQSRLAAMYETWPDDTARTRGNPFRTARDLCTLRLYPHYVMECARTGPDQAPDKIKIRFAGAGSFINFAAPDPGLAYQLAQVAAADPLFLCINDETGEHGGIDEAQLAADTRTITALLTQKLPNPAPWEILPHRTI